MTNQMRGRKKKNTNQFEEPPADLFRQHDIGGRVAVALEEHRRRSLRDFHGAVGDDRALPPASYEKPIPRLGFLTLIVRSYSGFGCAPVVLRGLLTKRRWTVNVGAPGLTTKKKMTVTATIENGVDLGVLGHSDDVGAKARLGIGTGITISRRGASVKESTGGRLCSGEGGVQGGARSTMTGRRTIAERVEEKREGGGGGGVSTEGGKGKGRNTRTHVEDMLDSCHCPAAYSCSVDAFECPSPNVLLNKELNNHNSVRLPQSAERESPKMILYISMHTYILKLCEAVGLCFTLSYSVFTSGLGLLEL
ncbi:hypothetical protein B296_00016952 [Ensete ventricosum]|uniref:Uncharacterized protein n=1 Tax=Ensete ventricosum TaxID=4639 RepID=A0A427B341_ENSVE|nr:hypothetical protein B296_00016952 [Ensete ventricosum]